MIAIDTNVLLYAHNGDDPRHTKARDALEWLAASGRKWALPLPCVVEFVRVLSHPAVLGVGLDEACTAIDLLLADAGGVLVALDAGGWPDLRLALVDGRARGNLAFDAHVVAACRAVGVTAILSEDRDLSRFRGARALRLDDDWRRLA